MKNQENHNLKEKRQSTDTEEIKFIFYGKMMGKQWKQCQTLFFWSPKSLQMVTAAMTLTDAYSLEGKL